MESKDPDEPNLPSRLDSPPSDLAPAAGPPPSVFRFGYHGEGTAFFLVLLKNILLTLVTAGIYAAWAKTNRRRYIWSHIELDGQRLGYTGTGKEIFIAYLKVGVFYLLFFVLPMAAGKATPGFQVVVQVLLGVTVLVLMPFAIYWSRAYLLSRTVWRAVRFGLVRGAREYAFAAIRGGLLTLVTLGFYGPFMINSLKKIMIDNTRYGTERFHYDGVGREVFWISLKGFLLTIVTLGIYSFWMQAELQRYYFAHTTFAGARGRLELTGGDLLTLFLLNVVATTMTFGVAFPWAATYSLRRVLGAISFEGRIDFAAIGQNAALAGAGGDALAGALDVGLGI